MIKTILKKCISFVFSKNYELLRSIGGYAHFSQFVKNHGKNSKLLSSTNEFYDYINALQNKDPIIYLEFGVFKGKSILYFSKINNHIGSIFIGFDSFEGLPEDWNLTGGNVIKKGTFNVNGQIPETSDPRVRFIKGYFQNTLLKFLEEEKNTLKSARKVIHFDADLYSSELFCLAQLYQYLNDGDLLFFDDFYVIEHDFRAFIDFTRSHIIDFNMVAHTKNFGKAAFRITKKSQY